MESAAHTALPTAPSWSIFVGHLGSVLIWAALGCFLAAVLLSVFGFKSGRSSKLSVASFIGGCLSIFGAITSLAILFANDRFEWKYVRGHSDLAAAIPYKVASVWSGQEGSFLLWGTCSAIFGLLTIFGTGSYRRWYIAVYSAFLASICGILTYESPFVLSLFRGQPVVPFDGVGLSPALLNYWVIIHPPTIFLGFGSLTVLFAYAAAALIQGNPVDWAKLVRPWALVSLALVGLGLCMGGFWAYETLGWGGFWAWDPVENTSFVPWCFLGVVVHGLIVQIARGKWHASNLLFAGLPFLSFLYGTFLTRSGFLGDTSVHSFAQMDSGALWILIGVGAVFTLGFIVLWALRRKEIFAAAVSEEARAVPHATGLSREGAYAWGSGLFTAFGIATAFGMSVPLLMSLAGQKPKMVEEWLYHQVLPWFFIPTILLMAAGPFISWRGTSWKALVGKLYAVTCITVFVVGCLMLVLNWTQWAGVIENKGSVRMLFGLFELPRVPWTLALASVCIFALVANTWRFFESFKRSKLGAAAFVSHIGVAVLMAGLILSRGLEQRQELLVQDNTDGAALGYVLSPKGPTGDILDRNNKIKFEIRDPAGDKHTIYPGFYFRDGGDQGLSPMAWPAVYRDNLHDVYLALHAMELNASEVVPLKPGQTAKFDRFSVTFESTTRDGAAGQAGTKFGAKLKFTDPMHDESFVVEPKWALGDQGIEQLPALIGDEFFMTIQSMDAGSKQYAFQLHFRQPIYAAELFVKPFVPLVWLGTGILTFAILLTAFYRRASVPVRIVDTETDVKERANTPETDAITSTA